MSEAGVDPGSAPLVARTVRIDDPGDLVSLLPADDAIAWLHRGDGLVGWGRAATFECSGPYRFGHAREWWSEVTRHAVVRDALDVPGSGLVAFGTFTFGPSADVSRLVVPEVVVGRRGKDTWVTTIGAGITTEPDLTPTPQPAEPATVRVRDGDIDATTWRDIVAAGVERIQAGDLDKVVLARELVGELDTRFDVRPSLRRLADDYPGCWTFHVDGFFGASPEMLVRLERGLVTSRVLAGTIRRTGDDQRDLGLASSLSHSRKDLEEHAYAVRSVAEVLEPYCSSTNVPEGPYVLQLPNVMHLATDVTGVASGAASSLSLAAALHPSAAVGGTPRREAMALIEQIEGLDRGRYTGPVGWIDADGDGEWAIGLRSARVADDGMSLRLFAGCGIVADSVPADELAESEAKLLPVLRAIRAERSSGGLDGSTAD